MASASTIAKLARTIAKDVQSSGSFKGTVLEGLRADFAHSKLTSDALHDLLAHHAGITDLSTAAPEITAALRSHADTLHSQLHGNAALLSHYSPKSFENGLHITEDAHLLPPAAAVKPTYEPNFFERLRGETSASLEARAAAQKEHASTKADLIEGMSIKRVEAENKVELEGLEKKLRQKYGLEKKPMGLAKKAVLGGGVAAGGVLGYNALTGGAANNGGLMAQAESEGAQAAIRDAMSQGYGPVMMGAPTTQITAANYNGRIDPSMARGLA